MSINRIVPVNPDHVSKWDTNTVIKWIKSMQEDIADQSKVQISYMVKVIKQKKTNGDILNNCSTQSQISKLFNGQIPDQTARILRMRLNIEKKAWAQREASKVKIKNGKWKPRLGEKIRCIDTRYKKKESFQATIMNMNQQNDIFVHYDSYATTNDQWIPRNEWQTRITIIEKYEIKPNWPKQTLSQQLKNNTDAAAAKRRQLKSSTSAKNSTHKPKSSQQQSSGYSTQFSTKKVTHWTCQDLQGWVKSLDLQKEKEVIAAVARDQLTGIEFACCESAEEIATGLKIDVVTAAQLFRALRKAKPFTKAQTQAISAMNNDAPPTYSEVKRDDALQQGYLMDNPPKPMFEVGQRVQAMDMSKYGEWYWYDAIIKDVNKVINMVKIGWLNDKWANKKWDKWFTPNETKRRIRDPVTKQPYITNKVPPTSNVEYIPPFVTKSIANWNIDDVGDWIDTLIISNNPKHQGGIRKNKKAMKKIVAANQINGVLLLSYDNGERLYDLFGATGGVSTSFCNKLWEELTVLLNQQKSQTAFTTKSVSKTSHRKLKHVPQSQQQSNIKIDSSAAVHSDRHLKHWTNKDLLAWIKTIGLEMKWEEIMTKAIESTGRTGTDLLAVEHFKEFAKALNIKQPMLANRVFREFKKVKQKQLQLNGNDESQPFAEESKPSKIVFVWQCKHINKWSCNELQEWICSLNLSKSIERKVIKAISEQEITGEDFNSMEDMSDVIDSFEIKQISAKKIYTALEHVRMNRKEASSYNRSGSAEHEIENKIKSSGVSKEKVLDAVELLTQWNLSQYKNVLIDDEGYDDPLYWKDISVEELKQIGFKTGHAKKFVDKSGKL